MEGGIHFAMHGRSRMTLGARRGTVLLLSYVCELLFFHSGSPPLHEKNVTRHIHTQTPTAVEPGHVLYVVYYGVRVGVVQQKVLLRLLLLLLLLSHIIFIYMRWREHTSSNSKVRTDKATQSDM